MKRPLLLSLVFLMTLPAGAEELSLADYAGIWAGRGTYQRETTVRSSGKLFCKLTITTPDASSMSIRGRCATPEGLSQGFATEVSAAGKSLSARDGDSGRRSSGSLGADGLILQGQDAKGTTLFSLSVPANGRIVMRSGSSEPGETTSATVDLKRR